MANNKNKTRPTKLSVSAYIGAVGDSDKRKDCLALSKIMRGATGKRAVLWGDSIVGFGQYHYKYDSGREGDHLVTGFSARKQNLVIYIMPGFRKYGVLMKKLGKHKHSVSCLYIKRLSDIDINVLTALIERSVSDMQTKYTTNLQVSP
jgi:hypothetical protein